MPYRKLPISQLIVNPANDRHGELENETAAIAQLFAVQEAHMRGLARDIVDQAQVYEPPLVFPKNDKYIVADGNRRTTCLKLLTTPRRAPTVELQSFFTDLRKKWKGKFPETIECRIETDRDKVDDILYRRHTGVQGGVGQSNWNDRMKNYFVVRTGKSTTFNIADDLERRLHEASILPSRSIPRSNFNRLLSAEAIRNRLGFSVRRGKLEFIRDERTSLSAIARVATDLATRKITLDNIWDTEAKLAYIDALELEGVLPKISNPPTPKPAPLPPPAPAPPEPPKPGPLPPPRPTQWDHLIPEICHPIVWTAKLHRHREIWDELQFKLSLRDHQNAISVLLRVLLELSTDHYAGRAALLPETSNEKLSAKLIKSAEHMHANGSIDQKYLGALRKLRQGEELVSVDTLNRYVHSPNFSVSPDHLKMLWNTLSEYISTCLNA